MCLVTRLKDLLDNKGIKPKQLADKWNLSTQYVSGLMNPKNSFGLEAVKRILYTFPDVNPRWFILGEGEMYEKKNKVEEPPAPYGKDEFIKYLMKDNEDLKKEKEYFKSKTEKLESELKSMQNQPDKQTKAVK